MAVRMLAIPLLVAALVAAAQSASLIHNDLAFTRLETEVSFWGRDKYMPTPATREKTSSGIEALITEVPSHPNYLILQASQLAWEGYWEDNEALSKQALKAQQKALEYRPAHGQAWVKMIEYLSLVPNKEPELKEAEAHLAKLARY